MISSFPNKIIWFLSRPFTTWIFIVIAILARTLQLIFFYNMRDDASNQVMAMQNFVNGHGFSISKALASDLSTTIYEPLINWPPGYSLLLSPFYLLFNQNYLPAALTLDIIAAIALIFTGRAILRILSIPLYFINLFTLVTGFFIYYFYFIASSDSVAITCFTIAIYLALRLIKKNKLPLVHVILMSLLLLLCGLIKYLFIPVVFLPPLLILLLGWLNKKAVLRNSGLLSLLILIAGLFILYLYQKNISGTAGYISSPGRGFFPEHLLLAYPFFPAAFIKPDTLAIITKNENWTSILYICWQIMQVIFLVFSLMYLVWRIFIHGIKKIAIVDIFYTLTFAISLLITGLLAILSLIITKEEILPGWLWTYIEEPRYYGLATVLIHIGIFVVWYYHVRSFPKIMKYLFYFFMVLLLIEFLRGGVFVANRAKNFNNEIYSWQRELAFQKFASTIVNSERHKKSVKHIVVTGSDPYMNNRVSIYDGIPVMKEEIKINNLSSLQAREPVILLVIIRDKWMSKFQSFLQNHTIKSAGKFEDYSFYTYYVNPS